MKKTMSFAVATNLLSSLLLINPSLALAQGSSHKDPVKAEVVKVTNEAKTAIGETKKVVNEELCNSGEEQCTFEKAAPKKPAKTKKSK